MQVSTRKKVKEKRASEAEILKEGKFYKGNALHYARGSSVMCKMTAHFYKNSARGYTTVTAGYYHEKL